MDEAILNSFTVVFYQTQLLTAPSDQPMVTEGRSVQHAQECMFQNQSGDRSVSSADICMEWHFYPFKPQYICVHIFVTVK